MDNWYEEMERAEQEYDAMQYELARSYEEGYHQGRVNAIDDLIEIVGELESCCIDHEENEAGEWLSFTFDYEKWADMLRKWEQLKEQKNEMCQTMLDELMSEVNKMYEEAKKRGLVE